MPPRFALCSTAAAIIVSALALGTGADAGTRPAPGTRPPLTATDSQEIALGAALAKQFDSTRGIQPTPESDRIQAYLQGIADSLGRYTKRRLPWTIHFDPHPGIKSGFALPGGHIVIWGGILSYMGTEDEAAAVIAHEIEHIDNGQVSGRIDSLVAAKHRDVTNASQWRWDEFGASYGPVLEYRCDSLGAEIAVKAGYSPFAYKTMMESFIALGKVHAPNAPPAKELTDRIDQIQRQIAEMHWDSLTKTRRLRLPGSGG
jgi:predicted Zn-dependent protease